MPQTDLFYIYLKKNPAFKKKFQKMWDALPYPLQARSKRMGPRFHKDVIKLVSKGWAWQEIADGLEVTPTRVRSTWKKQQT